MSDQLSSPHIHAPMSVNTMMQQVIGALLPGIVVATWVLGWGVLIHCCLAVVFAYACEAAILKIRRRPFEHDRSVIVTGLLFALTITPFTPWWITCAGIFFAVVIAKHVYGGLGSNLFNPAMAGYVFVLICFPADMNLWPLVDQAHDASASFRTIFIGFSDQVDSLSGATPLAFTKLQVGNMVMLSEVSDSPLYGSFGGRGWELIGLAFLAGGCWLLWKKIIQWQIPLTLLVIFIVFGMLCHHSDPERYPSALFHLFTGGTMLTAFFIATDPVTSAATPRGKMIYAAGIAVLAYTIRVWGGYPDGFAFAVLIANSMVPLIDSLTPPRLFGGSKRVVSR